MHMKIINSGQEMVNGFLFSAFYNLIIQIQSSQTSSVEKFN